MAKIAVELEHALTRRAEHGTGGMASARMIAAGDGWTVADVICTSGPQDRPFEERHARYTIAMVVAGSFEYKTPRGDALMTPGSLMLGNAGQCYECGHQHAAGDRCVSFWYASEYFERLASDSGARAAGIPERTAAGGCRGIAAGRTGGSRRGWIRGRVVGRARGEAGGIGARRR